MYVVKTVKQAYQRPPPHLTSTVIEAGNIMAATTQSHQANNTSGLRRGNELYRLDPATGELIEYKPYTSRADDMSAVRASYKALRYIILANFHGLPSEVKVVLTYSPERNPSPNDLYYDYKNFYKRLSRQYPGLEYIVIPEPHQNGRWHLHCLFKTGNNTELYIPRQQLETLWGFGIVSIQRIRKPQADALYLTSNQKKVTAERLALYPPRFKLYRCSRGIVHPQQQQMPRSVLEAKVLDQGYLLNYGDCVDVEAASPEDGTAICLNRIIHETYERKYKNGL